jgi:hypothetical protein
LRSAEADGKRGTRPSWPASPTSSTPPAPASAAGASGRAHCRNIENISRPLHYGGACSLHLPSCSHPGILGPIMGHRVVLRGKRFDSGGLEPDIVPGSPAREPRPGHGFRRWWSDPASDDRPQNSFTAHEAPALTRLPREEILLEGRPDGKEDHCRCWCNWRPGGRTGTRDPRRPGRRLHRPGPDARPEGREVVGSCAEGSPRSSRRTSTTSRA